MISRQNNLELHLGYHTCWLSYFTLVYLWGGRTVSRAGGRCTVTWLPNFLTNEAPLARNARAPLLYMAWMSGFKPGPHWWEAGNLNTVPSLVYHYSPGNKHSECSKEWGIRSLTRGPVIISRMPPRLIEVNKILITSSMIGVSRTNRFTSWWRSRAYSTIMIHCSYLGRIQRFRLFIEF